MFNFTIAEATLAVNGICVNGSNEMIAGVSTDTRQDLHGKLFVPIRGDSFDGHDFILSAYEKGAFCTISEKNIQTDKAYIFVQSSRQALMDLARWYRSRFDIPVVGVTGSVGKTTTKDMIASVLATQFNVLKNKGNFNNEIGLPLTVFEIDNNTQLAVLEMGMNSFGEISNLSKIATPDVCVITNIGVAHIANLGSREGILKAKSEIFDYMMPNGTAILNGDDDMLCTLKDKKTNTYYYGLDKNNFCTADKLSDEGISGTKWLIHVADTSFEIKIPIPGDYMIYNAMAAICCGQYFSINNDNIVKGIREFKLSQNRMDIYKSKNNITVINDVYNANPVSVKAAIDALKAIENRKVCIIGDMFELGDNALFMHYETGAYIGESGVDIAIFIGGLAADMTRGFKAASSSGMCNYFENVDLFLHTGLNLLQPNDTVLVKASRGMHFEKIIGKLTRC